jgi:hypothetical protein
VGTVVNQNRPLCNVGLVMKSYMEGTLSMTLGAWLVFTESYTGILDAALLGPSASTSIEWVDDAFFGYICSAKVPSYAPYVFYACQILLPAVWFFVDTSALPRCLPMHPVCGFISHG